MCCFEATENDSSQYGGDTSRPIHLLQKLAGFCQCKPCDFSVCWCDDDDNCVHLTNVFIILT